MNDSHKLTFERLPVHNSLAVHSGLHLKNYRRNGPALVSMRTDKGMLTVMIAPNHTQAFVPDGSHRKTCTLEDKSTGRPAI